MKSGFLNKLLLSATILGLWAPLSALAAGPVGVTVSWTAPTTNTDGSPLTDLRNFELKVGRASGQYAQSYNSGLNAKYDLDLDLGFYCFSVSAFDTSGNESPPSAELCATISENGATPEPPPGGVASGRTVPMDFTGSGVSNILTVARKSRGNKSDLLFKIFNSTDFSKIREATLGKVNDIAAPADYDGDGKVDLAVIQKQGKVWNWKVLQADGSTGDTRFGKTRGIPVAGCYFDQDFKAELVVLSKGGKLSYRASLDGLQKDVTLQGAPTEISSINCADITGDGLDELIIAGTVPASRAKVAPKTAAFNGLLSFDPLTGEKISSLKTKKNRGIIAADLNNDSLAEPAVVKKSQVEFFMQGEDTGTPVTINARSGLTAGKLNVGGGKVADALLYLKAGSQNVHKMSLSDLVEQDSGIALDKRAKEKLVNSVNSSLTR